MQADDWASNAVIDYGVGHLNASHVAIVGHTHCGGVKAAFNSPKPTSTTGQGKPHGGDKCHGKGKGYDKHGDDEDGEWSAACKSWDSVLFQ